MNGLFRWAGGKGRIADKLFELQGSDAGHEDGAADTNWWLNCGQERPDFGHL